MAGNHNSYQFLSLLLVFALFPSIKAGNLKIDVVSENGKMTPARVAVRDADGRWHINRSIDGPQGIGPTSWKAEWKEQNPRPPSSSIIDGSHTFTGLPDGPAEVFARKGFAYPHLHQKVVIKGDSSLKIELKAIIDLPRENWYSIDMHSHLTGDHKEAKSENAYAEWHRLLPLIQEAEDINITSKQNWKGSALLFDARQDKVLPYAYSFGYEFEKYSGGFCLTGYRDRLPEVYDEGYFDGSFLPFAAKSRELGAFITCFSPMANSGDWLNGDIAAAWLTGNLDALHIMDNYLTDQSPAGRDERQLANTWERCRDGYYTFLNAGLQIPAVGGGSHFPNSRWPCGGNRGFVKLAGNKPFSFRNVLGALRDGNTFCSNGPLLFFEVEGKFPGQIVDLAEAETLAYRIRLVSNEPMQTVQIVRNGKAIVTEKVKGAGPDGIVDQPFTGEVEIDKPCWLAACAYGESEDILRPRTQMLIAHSSAIFFRVEGKNHIDKKAVDEIRDGITKMQARCAKSKIIPVGSDRPQREPYMPNLQLRDQAVKRYDKALEILDAIQGARGADPTNQ
jgi:hypothetical protein